MTGGKGINRRAGVQITSSSMIQGEERGAAHANTLQVDMQHDTNPRQALYKIIYIHSLSEACRGAHA